MRSVHYLHSANVQIPSANAVQTMHMCEAFAGEGASVELSYPRYLWGNVIAARDCHSYYGVENTFRLRPLAAPFTAALMGASAYLPPAKLAAYLVETVHDTVAHPGPSHLFYTRCATAALAMPFLRRLMPSRPLVMFEAHEYPRDRKRAEGLRHVDAVVAITRSAADDLHDGLGFPRGRVLVAPDGVPDAWLEPLQGPHPREQLQLNPSRPLVVYTGRVQADTLPMLIDAADGLRERAEVVVVGAPPGDLASSESTLRTIRAEAAARGLPIRFVGAVPVSEVRLYQLAADVLIAPYSGALRWARYASPLKLFEYMAAGKPMVVSDLPVFHEVLEHERSALFVPPASGAAIAQGVIILLDHPELAARIAARAKAEAATYSWSRRAQAILDFAARRPWEMS